MPKKRRIINFSNYILLIISIILLMGCTGKKSSKYFKQLQGDWTAGEYYYYTFHDSLYNSVSYVGNIFNNFEKFEIFTDTLILHDESNNFLRKYLIDKLTQKKLFLRKIDDKGVVNDQIVLTKLQDYHSKTFNLQKMEVMFEYPALRMIFAMDSSRSCYIRYWEEKVNAKQNLGWSLDSGYYGKVLTKNEFQFFENKVRVLPLNKFKKNYKPRFNDRYPIIKFILYIKIIDTGKINKIELSAKGINSIPVELNLLLSYIFHIDQYMHLGKLLKKYEFEIKYSKLQEWNMPSF